MDRLTKLRQKMQGICDAALITNEKNIRYLCGFDYTDGCLVISQKDAILFCDFRYIEAAKMKAYPSFRIIMTETKRSDWLSRALCDMNVSTLGYEDSFVTVSEFNSLRDDIPSKIELAPLKTTLEELREFKDETEIQSIVKAQRIAEKAFTHILEFINPERTEREIALELDFTMRRLGADGNSFETIAVSGSASSMPHGVPRDIKLENGFLTMDFGALYDGYCSDMTRTVCIGKADDEMKRVYNTVLEAQKIGLETIDFGVKCFDADKAARDYIYSMGYKGCFGHSLGHGVGMYIHEAPALSPKQKDTILKSGHVVTCEPGIYIEGKYGVRIEDMVVFHTDSKENITKSPKELIEIY